MRTAEQILKDNDLAIDRWPDTKIMVERAINDARKEALQEAAKKVPWVNRINVLNLINELK